MNGKISFDTNIVIRLFKNDPLVTKRLTILSTIYLPTPVVVELLFTARNLFGRCLVKQLYTA